MVCRLLNLATLCPILLCFAGCAEPVEEIEETQVMGQMLRGGQSHSSGDSFIAFDVKLTERRNGPKIPCSEGKLDVRVEVSTNGGRRFSEVDLDRLRVDCKEAAGPDIAVVVDNSGSQEGQLGLIQRVTSHFVDEVVALNGRASIVRVSTESRVVQGLTNDQVPLEAAIDDFAVSNGWTALYDGIRLGNETLEGSAMPEDDAEFDSVDEFCDIEPQRAVVVFTDGKENNSSDLHATENYPGDGVDTTFSDVKQLKVRGTKTPVYTIGVGNEVDHKELNRLGVHSGGKHHALRSLDELAETFEHVAGYSKGGRFRVCGDLGISHCGSTDVRTTYFWTDGEREIKGSDTTTIQIPCADERGDRGRDRD